MNKKILILFEIVALASFISCGCPASPLGKFFFNNIGGLNLAVGPISAIFDLASEGYQVVQDVKIGVLCWWFKIWCPPCQNLKPMSDLDASQLTGSWFAVASKNFDYDDNLSCRRESFSFSGTTATWATTSALNDGSIKNQVIGSGQFVNGVMTLSNGITATVLATNYKDYLIYHVCEPSDGAYQDKLELLVRDNTTFYLDLPIVATVFKKVVFDNKQPPLSLPFVGRCACSNLPPV